MIRSRCILRHLTSSPSRHPGVRTNVALVGAMNAGKSTLMNLLVQQATSIVDATPGTTADTKISSLELHALGPCKLFDTPGIDESSELGSKKRDKAMDAMKRADVAMVVVSLPVEEREGSVENAEMLLAELREGLSTARPLVVVNTKGVVVGETVKNSEIDAIEVRLRSAAGVAPDQPLPFLVTDLQGSDAFSRVTAFLAESAKPYASPVPLLPTDVGGWRDEDHLRDAVVLLNVPMDEETPSGRLLRPQAWAQEQLLRNFVSSYVYRMDLKKARGSAEDAKEEEMRFRGVVDALTHADPLRPKLLITDSQAMDKVHPWTLGKELGDETIAITTFSVMMINFLSGGRLPAFIDGLQAFVQAAERAKESGGEKQARVLICEACNHDRIADDIGTVQIPRLVEQRIGPGIVHFEWSFGREYATMPLDTFDAVFHCGGCMIDQQAMRARIADLQSSNVPITNYGLLLAYLNHGQHALERVVRPWQ